MDVRKIRLTSADKVYRTRPCRLLGFAIRESGGSSSATMLIYDAATAITTDDVIPVSLSAGESAREWWAGAGGDDLGPGVLMENGIYIDVGGSGTVQGVLFVAGS